MAVAGVLSLEGSSPTGCSDNQREAVGEDPSRIRPESATVVWILAYLGLAWRCFRDDSERQANRIVLSESQLQWKNRMEVLTEHWHRMQVSQLTKHWHRTDAKRS